MTKVTHVEEDLGHTGHDEDDEDRTIWSHLRCVVVNFSMTDDAKSCVVELIEYGGYIERFACTLPQGLGSEQIGVLAGTLSRGRIRRKPWDALLPKNWEHRPPDWQSHLAKIEGRYSQTH